MSKEVPWSRDTLDFFIHKANLNDKEIYIMESRIKGSSVTEQSLHLGYSVSQVHRYINALKHKYDIVQEQYPDRLPPRIKKSAKEKWMDTH